MNKPIINTANRLLTKAKILANTSISTLSSLKDKDKQIELAESGKLPDAVLRSGMRQLMRTRLKEEFLHAPEIQQERHNAMIKKLRTSPIAIETDTANEQHYEVPTQFYRYTLGRHLKYSCAYYPEGCDSLDEAEAAMLALYLQRAELEDGMSILELGCGWGSLTLWIAKHLPNTKITAVSNSATQREHIMNECEKYSLNNVDVLIKDINDLKLRKKFDRVISIEMFEHMRNYQQLLSNVASWLKADGKLFVHIFCHKTLLYPFEVNSHKNWISKHFSSGGLMPSSDTLLHFQDDLKIVRRWHVDGTHYAQTCNAWLEKADQHRHEIIDVFKVNSNETEAKIQLQRWRMFFMACSELFGYKNGTEWMVAHYLFEKR